MLLLGELGAGQEVEGWADILDAHPDPGVEIAKVVVSSDARLRAVLEPIPEIEQRTSEFTGSLNRLMELKRRWRLKVAYRAQDSVVMEEAVTLVPSAEGYPPLRIPVVASLKQRPYSLTPSTLVMPLSQAGSRLRRVVTLALQAGEEQEVVVLKSPAFLRVEMLSVDSKFKRVIIDCTIPSEVPMGPQVVVLGKASDRTPVAELPIVFLGRT
jgi:hypothetical protein